MNRKINIGVLGKAQIAVRSVIPAIQELSPYFNLIGIARRAVLDEDLSSTIQIFEGYETILSSGKLDAVYIPLPASLHYEWTKKSLKKGLHVLVEKSLACTYEQVKELNKLAKSNNKVLLENFQFRFHSQLSSIMDLVNKNTIGDIRIFRSTFCIPPFSDENKIQYKKELGGGALLDTGAYPLKLSQLFLGNNLKVSAAKMAYSDDLGIDIFGGAFLEQIDGPLFSEIAFGFDNHYQCNLEIVGSKGKIIADRIFTCPPEFSPWIKLERGYEKEILRLSPDNHFKNMLLHFRYLIQGEMDRKCEYSDNINQARLISELTEIALK